jgi:nickel-dependent lactate racemase
MDAGYSGGAKIVLPGVCGRETVDAFHARAVDVVGNQLGQVDTPLRVALEHFVERHVGLDFILNAVLNGDGRLYKCVAGHFRQAHRVGVAYADEVYGVAVSGTYPVVFANAFPTDLDLWQATKAIGSGELITRDGGLLILVAACPRGTRDHARFAAYLGQDPERLRSRLSRGAEQDPVGCALAILLGRMKRRIRLGVVSDGLGADVARQMGVRYFETAEAAVSAVLSEEDRQAKIAVVTHGGVTLPRLRPAGDDPQPGIARKPMEKG